MKRAKTQFYRVRGAEKSLKTQMDNCKKGREGQSKRSRRGSDKQWSYSYFLNVYLGDSARIQPSHRPYSRCGTTATKSFESRLHSQAE